MGNMNLLKFVVAISFLFCSVSYAASQGGISHIVSTETKLIIRSDVPPKPIKIVELSPVQDYNREGQSVVWSGIGCSQVSIERFDGEIDRLYSKFLAVDALTDVPLGGSQFVTDFSLSQRRSFALPQPDSIKGLSCIVDIDDAIDLGVKYVHENVFIGNIVDLESSDSGVSITINGTKVPINMNYIKGLDGRLKRFADAGIAVFVVFINHVSRDADPNNPLVHPNTDIKGNPTQICSFNTTTKKGLDLYIGALEFMAERYTRRDAKYGLISSIIVGNEIQQHWVWHNAGDMEQHEFIQQYVISLRLAWLAVQKYHSDLKVYISMDHHWTKRGSTNNKLREIPGDKLIYEINRLTKKHGDFDWNVAFHPYPENLFKPQFWQDRTPTDDFSTPVITFKNIEVLPRFMKQKELLCNGTRRDIALTEQGFHTPDGPDGEIIQAAAYAYAYYKTSRIPEISAFILHRHVDHKEEGGLRLGLWTNDPGSDDVSSMHEKKYLWDVFKYADTDQWQRYFKFAKPILGIEQWGDEPVCD